MRRCQCVVGLLVLVGAVSCQPEADRSAVPGASVVTVYSGRSERLIGPLLEAFSQKHGIEVKVRFGETAELVATILEEGEHTPADLFLSQDAAALGALSHAGRLTRLPDELLSRVQGRFSSSRGDWVGLSGRARVVVYNTERTSPEELPQDLDEVTDPRFRGRFGLAPANASFQAHLAMFHAAKGREALREWLAAVVVNEPQRYPKNSAIVEAVIAGEIDWGLVNHYYLWRALQENPSAPARNFFMPRGDVSNFINVAGAALLRDQWPAHELLAYLLSEEAQRYFAEETYEYPLVGGVSPAVNLIPLDELPTPAVDFVQVSRVLEETLSLISQSGLLL